MNIIFSLIQKLFFLFMALFLIGGVAIVATQIFGVFAQSGEIVTGVNNWLAPVTFACATLCALCAFVLNYSPAARAQRAAESERGEERE